MQKLHANSLYASSLAVRSVTSIPQSLRHAVLKRPQTQALAIIAQHSSQDKPIEANSPERFIDINEYNNKIVLEDDAEMDEVFDTIKRFLRNPLLYLFKLAKFAQNSLQLTPQFYYPQLNSTLQRTLGVLAVVVVFCTLIANIDSACSLLINMYKIRLLV